MEFEEFVTARIPALMRYASVLTGDRESARDIVQAVLEKALIKWRLVRRSAEPSAYIRAMITNEFLSHRRRRRAPTVPLTFEALDGPAAPGVDPYIGVDDRDDLWRRLMGLPPRQRAVIVLRYYEDLSDHEIANVLGCRPATVRGYAARALTALRIDLNQPATATIV